MSTLYFDTETTGLPAKGVPAGSPVHPHIVQLGAMLVNDDGRVVSEINLLVKPDHWGVPDEAAKVHGITTAMCEQFGLPIKSVITLFGRLVQRSSLLVAHNFEFDKMMVWTELLRTESANELAAFLGAPSFCTMEASTPILNLPPSQRMIAAGFNRPKNPNLGEAYRFFTGKEFVGAHDAYADVVACRAVHAGILAWQAKQAKEPLVLDEV